MDSYTSVPQAKILFSSRGGQYFLCLNRLMRPKLSGNLCYLRTIFEGTTRPGYTSLVVQILTFSVSAGTVLVKRRSPLLPLGWSRTFLSHMIIQLRHRPYHEPGFYSPYHHSLVPSCHSLWCAGVSLEYCGPFIYGSTTPQPWLSLWQLCCIRI